MVTWTRRKKNTRYLIDIARYVSDSVSMNMIRAKSRAISNQRKSAEILSTSTAHPDTLKLRFIGKNLFN